MDKGLVSVQPHQQSVYQLLDLGQHEGEKWYFRVEKICIFLTTNEAEYIFMCLKAIYRP